MVHWLSMARAAVALCFGLVYVHAECEKVPSAAPKTLAVRRNFWSVVPSFSFQQILFDEKSGRCHYQGEGARSSFSCTGKPSSVMECAEECEERSECTAFDVQQKFDSDCCLFSTAVEGDGSAGWNCYVKQNDRSGGNLGEYASVYTVPSLFSTVMHMDVPGLGFIASSTMGFCMPWSFCDFNVYDCAGDLLYTFHATSLQNMYNDEMKEWAYEIADSIGRLIGRTDEMQSGYHPIRLYDEESRTTATTSTRWNRFSALYSGTWYVNNEFSQENVADFPLADPRLMGFLVAHQFQATGWFGPFWTLMLFLLVCLVFIWYRIKKAEEYRKLREAEIEARRSCWSRGKEAAEDEVGDFSSSFLES